MKNLILFLSCLSLSIQAAETWNWLATTKKADDGTSCNYGFSSKASANWRSVATGSNSLPRSGDFVISNGKGQFGADFSTALAFGGIRLTSNVSGELVSQGTLALQADGSGLVLDPAVSSVGTINGFLAFTGAGLARVDIQNKNCTLTIQKGFYGNSDVTLVKDGPGTLRVNDYYRAAGNTRDTRSGYFPNRRFVFGGFKLRQGRFIARQFYTVDNLDFQFDGNDATLDLCGTDAKSDELSSAVSWRLKGGCFRETANCTEGTHIVTAETSVGKLELVGTRESTDFSGKFTGAAGLIWNPDNAAEFVFRRTVSDSTGRLTISNGTVRVTDGAGFSQLESISVDGPKAVFAVDPTAAQDFSQIPLTLSNGGRLSPKKGSALHIKSLFLADTNAALVVDGLEDWFLIADHLNFTGDLGSPHGAILLTDATLPPFSGRQQISPGFWFPRDTTLTFPSGCETVFDSTLATTNTKSLSVSVKADSCVTFNGLFMSRNGSTISGDGRLVFKNALHVRDRFSLSGNPTLELHATGNRLNGNLGSFSGGTIKAMAPYVITKQNTIRQAKASADGTQSADNTLNTFINAKDTFTLDLNGFDQSIDTLAMHADGTKDGGRVYSQRSATLHLQTSASYWPQHNYSQGFSDYKSISSNNSYGYEAADKGHWEGGVSLSFEAATTMTRSMMRTSSTTGRLEVVSGTLVFLRRARALGETFDLKGGNANPYPRLTNEDGAWPRATAVSVTGGCLRLEHSRAFSRDVSINLAGTGTIELAEGVVLCCRELIINGKSQPAGQSYSSENLPSLVGPGRIFVRGDRPSSVLSLERIRRGQ